MTVNAEATFLAMAIRTMVYYLSTVLWWQSLKN